MHRKIKRLELHIDGKFIKSVRIYSDEEFAIALDIWWKLYRLEHRNYEIYVVLQSKMIDPHYKNDDL